MHRRTRDCALTLTEAVCPRAQDDRDRFDVPVKPLEGLIGARRGVTDQIGHTYPVLRLSWEYDPLLEMWSPAITWGVAITQGQVIPPWLSVHVAGHDVVLASADGRRHEVYMDVEAPAPDPDRCRTIGYHLLDEIQDLITESTSTPWPIVTGRPTELPLPMAQVRDGMLFLWYGEAENPALKFPPVSLHDICA
jgi:hypothetical protein